MATIESDKAHDKLVNKLHCHVEDKKRDHDWYFVFDAGKYLSRTCISKGPRHTIREKLAGKMAHQLGVGTTANLIDFLDCKISKEECLTIIRFSLGPTPSPTSPESEAEKAIKTAKAEAAAKIGTNPRPKR